MRFMAFIRHEDRFRGMPMPEGFGAAMGEFVTEQMKNGSIVDTAGLAVPADTVQVKLAGGKVSLIDGPYAEAKEMIGGYAIIEAPSKNDAVAIATRFMDLHRIHWPEFEGRCEVRPFDAM